jgi:hypothetical protein
MLGNVSKPKLVGPAGIKVTFNKIIMDRWTGFRSKATFLSKDRPNVLLGTEFPDSSFTGPDPNIGGFIGYEPKSGCRIIRVNVIGGIDQMSISPIPLTDRVFLPLIERLLRKT